VYSPSSLTVRFCEVEVADDAEIEAEVVLDEAEDEAVVGLLVRPLFPLIEGCARKAIANTTIASKTVSIGRVVLFMILIIPKMLCGIL
jgi:hypothetical protein